MVQKQQISKLNQEKEVLLQAVDLKVDEFNLPIDNKESVSIF